MTIPKRLSWAFATQYSEQAKCLVCGAVLDKKDMAKIDDGWFCNADEVYWFWLKTQGTNRED